MKSAMGRRRCVSRFGAREIRAWNQDLNLYRTSVNRDTCTRSDSSHNADKLIASTLPIQLFSILLEA